MAVTLEQVEKLREKSGCSYEACRDALERSGGDLLDAVIFLERTGQSRTASGSTFTTAPGSKTEEAVKLALDLPGKTGKKGKKNKKGKSADETDWKEWLRELWAVGLNLLRHSTVNQFEVWRKGRMMTSIPILILVLLVVVAFWISVPLLIVGLFIGCRYRFVGPDLGKESINDVMDNVSATVDDMVGQVKREFDKDKKKAKKPQGAADRAERRADGLIDQVDRMVDELDDALSGEKKK